MKNKGFTIIELMIAIALLSVMVSVAIPAFGNLFQNNTLTTLANSFSSNIALARSEAIKRNVQVSMCALNDDASDCGSDGEWEDGWAVWIDTDSDNSIDAAEFIISWVDSLPSGYTLRSVNNIYANRMVFNQDGAVTGDGGSAVDIIRICDVDGDANINRSIQLNAVGRAFVDTNVVGTGCP